MSSLTYCCNRTDGFWQRGVTVAQFKCLDMSAVGYVTSQLAVWPKTHRHVVKRGWKGLEEHECQVVI